jgi:flagellar hook assembly protein FlgD
VPVAAGSKAMAWDGRDLHGAVAPDGEYDVQLSLADAAGNPSPRVTRTVRIATTLGFVTSSKAVFFPHDADTYARTTVLGYRLARPATVTWTIRNAAGAIVGTLADAQPRDAGSYAFTFDGMKLDRSARLPAGKYTSYVVATDDLTTTASSVAFEMNAYAISVSDATPARGQKVTISATAAEPQNASPRVSVVQPGKATWSVAMVRLGPGRYRAVVTIKTGGGAGTIKFRVYGADAAGRKSWSQVSLPLH